MQLKKLKEEEKFNYWDHKLICDIINFVQLSTERRIGREQEKEKQRIQDEINIISNCRNDGKMLGGRKSVNLNSFIQGAASS